MEMWIVCSQVRWWKVCDSPPAPSSFPPPGPFPTPGFIPLYSQILEMKEQWMWLINQPPHRRAIRGLRLCADWKQPGQQKPEGQKCTPTKKPGCHVDQTKQTIKVEFKRAWACIRPQIVGGQAGLEPPFLAFSMMKFIQSFVAIREFYPEICAQLQFWGRANKSNIQC